MSLRGPIQIIDSRSNAVRLAAARAFVETHARNPVLVVGPSREAVDDFVREIANERGATFGLHRFSFMQLVGFLAAGELANANMAPATQLGLEAVAARSAFHAKDTGRIPKLAPVCRFPGFARALAATVSELRHAKLASESLKPLATDLAVLLGLFEENLEEAAIADRARMLKLAVQGLASPAHAPLRDLPLLWLDVPIETELERAFVTALLQDRRAVFATLPEGDVNTRRALEALGHSVVAHSDTAARRFTSLARLRTHLFAETSPPSGDFDQNVRFLSAPGEQRECVEITRAILIEARRGVAFDDMAVFVRAPEIYSTFLDTGLRRGGVPAYFARGMKRPDPAGRAFLALLACCTEGLSARRFAEYLSFAQVPIPDAQGAPPADAATWETPFDELLGAASRNPPVRVVPSRLGEAQQLSFWDAPAGAPQTVSHGPSAPLAVPGAPVSTDHDDSPTLDGSLRAPWKWEEYLVEAAVIGSKERWLRRLDGLQRELEVKASEIANEDPESARVRALRRDLVQLGHLRRFAVPVIETLDAFPKTATWGEWAERLSDLAPRVLRQPSRVLSVLTELQPMARIGPVPLDEVREVLTHRLSTLEEDPPAARYGRVFVGTPDLARARSFRIVFVPGLAERIFPERPREDPLLLDALRQELSVELRTQADRVHAERMMLRLAVGAAEECVVFSYPRIDAVEARPRVPSFYALDVARATSGSIPDSETLERRAAAESQARLAWPAPPDPGRAIDAVEHDLAVIGPLLYERTPEEARGRARYLLRLNEHLARSLRGRWQRWNSRWSAADGLVGASHLIEPYLQRHRLNARPYSVTALQKYAVCPYQFLLAAVHRLEPRREAVALVQMDPLTRGRMFHEIQATAFRELQRQSQLPVTSDNLEAATGILDEVIGHVADAYHEDLAPPILRVWEDEVSGMRADLRIWLRRMSAHPEWIPQHFEFSFGLEPHADATRDPRSVTAPVTLPEGWHLRGAVDLIERRQDGAYWRITDHKTGRDDTVVGMIVAGGRILQPVLYALAVESAFGEPVLEGRLSFCTRRGDFAERVVPLDERARYYTRQALELIDQAVQKGVLLPVPEEHACTFCDFRSVCGPHEERRSGNKQPSGLLHELEQIRDLT